MKKYLLSIIAIVLFLMVIKVNALCTSKKYSDLKMIAYKSEVSYELKFDEAHNAYFEITVNNVDNRVLVSFNGTIYEPENGMVVIPNRIYGGMTYEIKLYGGYDTACVEEYLYTKKITIPTYNKYSERDECIEYEEFYMCNKWYSGSISSDEVFESELQKYIDSLKVEDKEEVPKKEKGIFEKAIDFYVKYLVITLPITIAIAGFIVYRIIVKAIRRKNRIKLEM